MNKLDRKKVVGLIIAAIIITNATTLFLIERITVNTQGVSLSNINKYNNVKRLLKTKYINNIDDNTLMEEAIRGLTNAAEDPYTEYMDKKEFESLEIYTKANYAGVGVVVSINPKDNLIMVSEVIENSPAQKAKIMAGDKIIKINDLEVSGNDFDKAVSMIRGEKGTGVKISVFREDIKQILDIDVTRDEIEIKTVKSKLLDNNIGYIRILQFAESTSKEFENTVEKLQYDGASKFIIDVRDNPGGVLEQVVKVSSQLLPKGLVVYTINREGKREDYYSKGSQTQFPFVILINDRSASASEILAGAVKDYKRGLLIGTKTYGKGVVQSLYELGDGSALKLTTSKYYTPKGVSIHKVGVEPDIVVELDSDKVISKLTLDEDTQLKKAIEVISNQ